MNRINAIYARQSVDRADSISIESQIEFCKYELKGGSFREYRDRGYSGKNTTRPQLQQLLADIRRGEIGKVIVYKLDRISRSILDFSNMMELFQQYQVEFVSSTEKFDTSTPMGRAMLNICIVFAQLERETIQKRVCDAYYSRSQKGFHMGGKPPYGYRLEEIVMDGIHTKKLVEEPEEGEIVREIFRMYCQPETSYGATSAEENPQPDNTAYAYGQTAYQQAYQSEQSQPNAYQQAYYGQTQAKGTGTGFGIASLVLGILSVFTFACCINYILAVLAIIFGIVQMVKNEKKGLAIGGIITAVISIVLGIAVSLYAVNIAEKMQDPDSPFYQYFEEYEQKLEEGKSSF